MKLLIINGKTATGKDSIINNLNNVKKIILYTTRKPRTNELDGKDYFFLNSENCDNFVKHDNKFSFIHDNHVLNYKNNEYKIIESRSFVKNGEVEYFYTLDDGQIDVNSNNIYVTINTPEGTRKLINYYDKYEVIPVKIVVNRFERIKRALRRALNNENSGKLKNLCTFFEREFSDLITQRNSIYTAYGLDNIIIIDNSSNSCLPAVNNLTALINIDS